MSQTIQIPSLTTAERNVLVGVKDGMMIFNTDVQLNQSWDGAAWIDVGGVAGNTVVNLATVVDPNVTSYSINTYSNMVNTWSGSPVIGPGELDIGQTVELKVFFNLDPSLIGAHWIVTGKHFKY